MHFDIKLAVTVMMPASIFSLKLQKMIFNLASKLDALMEISCLNLYESLLNIHLNVSDLV